MTASEPDPAASPTLACAAVLGVLDEETCSVWRDGEAVSVAIAPQLPSPRAERIAPGHLVAIATSAAGAERVVWRWFDAVVLGEDADGVRLWEPAHGVVHAQPRPSYPTVAPGGRAWASAGLPGADWWVTGAVSEAPEQATVELDAVDALYTEYGLWTAAFD